MNKNLILMGVILLLLVGVGVAYFFFSKDKSSDAGKAGSTSQATTDSQAGEGDETNSEVTGEGRYVEYSEGLVASTDGQKILFFHAPWCPQCRALEDSIESGSIPENVTIFKVDYDSSQALRQKYGVMIQTTLVEVDDAGNKIDSFVAYDDPSLEAVEDRLL